MTGHRQVGRDVDAAGSVDRHAEARAERRGRDARGPQDRARFEALVADGDARRIHGGDALVREHFDAERFELCLRRARRCPDIAGTRDSPSRRRVLDADRRGGSRRATRCARSAIARESTPVGPPPTTTNVSAARRSASSRSATRPGASKTPPDLRRVSSSSSGRELLHSRVRSSCASARREHGQSEAHVAPSTTTTLPAGRTAIASPSTTSVFFCLRNTLRTGATMSAGLSVAVATGRAAAGKDGGCADRHTKHRPETYAERARFSPPKPAPTIHDARSQPRLHCSCRRRRRATRSFASSVALQPIFSRTPSWTRSGRP